LQLSFAANFALFKFLVEIHISNVSMSTVNAILQREDMEVTRTPRGLCEWVRIKTTELSETDEAKRYARSGELLPKKFFEEIRPLCLFAQLRYGLDDGVWCTPKLGNDNYDATIEFSDEYRSSVYVEITYAKDGYDESLRLEILSDKGLVNVLGRITKSGTKASGRRSISVENEAVRHDEVRSNALNIVKERILSKSSKKYGKNHILLVVVDDYIPFRFAEDKKMLEGLSKSVIEGARPDFRGVVLLGESGNYLACVYGEI